VADCQRIALQLAEALTVAHRQRVIHGDIRPENVLLDEHGNAKLADFGFVRAAVATDVTLLGTVQRAAYSPPELPIRERGEPPTAQPSQAAWRSEPRQRQRGGPNSGVLMTLLPLLATAALIAAAVGGIMFFIPRLFDGFRMTDVPNLIGRPMPEAIGIAESSG